MNAGAPAVPELAPSVKVPRICPDLVCSGVLPCASCFAYQKLLIVQSLMSFEAQGAPVLTVAQGHAFWAAFTRLREETKVTIDTLIAAKNAEAAQKNDEALAEALYAASAAPIPREGGEGKREGVDAMPREEGGAPTKGIMEESVSATVDTAEKVIPKNE